METLESTLSAAGLTPIEIKVYLALVDAGSCSAGVLSRKAGVHRRLVYDAVERLITKGLVGSITKNNRALFEAASPSRFLEIHDERRAALGKAVKQLDTRWLSRSEEQQTLLFEGKSGVKTALEDQLRAGKEILIVGSGIASFETMKWYFTWFDERRKKAKIRVRTIFEESARSTLPSIPLSSIRFLPKENMGATAINVYGDNVALVLWGEKPLAIVIRNKEMAAGYRKFFELLWNNAKA